MINMTSLLDDRKSPDQIEADFFLDFLENIKKIFAELQEKEELDQEG